MAEYLRSVSIRIYVAHRFSLIIKHRSDQLGKLLTVTDRQESGWPTEKMVEKIQNNSFVYRI